MDFIYQKIDKILRTYGDVEHVALADVYLNFPELSWEGNLRGIIITEAKELAEEHGSDEEYDDMCSIASWYFGN